VQCKKPKSVNYRHAFHAGNYADVFKHALLVRLLRGLQRKEKGFLFLDTHAGRGRYDLSQAAHGDSRPRDPEWPAGIGRLWDRADAPPEVQDYLDLVRAYDRRQGNLTAQPRFYPGSPRIARLVGRPQDRLELWEKHSAECAVLRDAFEGERRVTIREADGYGAMKACLPPAERRALVLVDPPFEEPGEWPALTRALEEGLERAPAATMAVWYPLTARARTDFLPRWLRRRQTPSLCAELVVDPQAPRMTGCGIAVLNPPWRFEGEASRILDYLGVALGRGQAAQGSVRWVVPE
jgi:23S rRNA (adenine2030-N6)-methyltransferase